MNLLAEFDFVSGTQYFAMQEVIVAGKQYNAKIIEGTELTETATMDGGYEIPVKKIILIDEDRAIRKLFFDERSREILIGTEVRLYDESVNLLNTSIIEGHESREDLVLFKLSDKTQLKQPFTTTIQDGGFNNVYIKPEVRKQVIPMVFNTWKRIKAWLIDNRINNGKWLLGSRQISTVTRVEVNGRVITNNGFTFWELNNDGNYWWLDMGHPEIMGPTNGSPQFCWVDVTTPAYTPLEAITSAFSGILDVDTNAAFASWLSSRGINSANFHMYIREQMSASELLQKYSQNINAMWRKDGSDEIIFEFIDRENIAVDGEFIEDFDGGDIPLGLSQNNEYSPETIKNKINTSFDFNYQENKYDGYGEYKGTETDDGIFEYDLDLEFIDAEGTAYDIATETYELNKYQAAPISFVTTWDIGKDIFPGSKIQSRHRALKTTNMVFGVVLRRRVSPANHTITFDFVDLNFLKPTSFLLDTMGTPICFDGELLITV